MTTTILAVLAHGPQDEESLCDLAKCSRDVLRASLRQLKAAGKVKRTGLDARWALGSHTAKCGRPIDPDPENLAEVVTAFLVSGPQAMRNFAERFHWSRTTTHRRLTQLAAQRVIVRVGKGRSAAWALPGYVAPEVPKKGRATPIVRKPHYVDAKLRQPGPAERVPRDGPPSWWVGVDRSEFQARADAHQAELAKSVAARWVPLRLLQ